jgi:hypothetical protein
MDGKHGDRPSQPIEARWVLLVVGGREEAGGEKVKKGGGGRRDVQKMNFSRGVKM